MSNSNSSSVSNTQLSAISFEEHLLKRRLKRLPISLLINFWKDEIEFRNKRSQKSIVEILTEYQIRQNNIVFINKFKDFLRDVVLTAREADYLVSVKKPKQIIKWIESWENNVFGGFQHKFQLHTTVDLNHRVLELEADKVAELSSAKKQESEKIYYPTSVIFVVATSRNIKHELNGLEEISYYPTTEFEIVIRKDLDIVEIRGSYKVVKDFVSSAMVSERNPLSAARSYFIGDRDDTNKSITNVVRQVVKIDTLRNLLNGSYKKISSDFPGSKVCKFEATLENLKNFAEETHPEAQAVLEEMMKHPVKGHISFTYNKREYSFSITKTGGMLFREYVPEEVVTYILYNVKLSGKVLNGSQNF